MLNKGGGEHAHVEMQRINNHFWRDVLTHFKKLCSKYVPDNIHDFISECIHYNINIIRDKKTAYIKEWVEADLLFIRQFVNLNGQFMT